MAHPVSPLEIAGPDTLVLRRGDLIPLKRPGLNVGSGHLKV